MNHVSVICEVCDLVASGDTNDASKALAAKYPRATFQTKRSLWSEGQMMRVFLRDHFTDRYFGERMVFPGALRALSLLMPKDFPYHRNWKQSQTHPAFWELYPTIDHVRPLARGGDDDESNVVTTSMVRNAAKGNWLLEELGWPIAHAPVAESWDGLLGWFFAVYDRFPVLGSSPALRRWHRAARSAA